MAFSFKLSPMEARRKFTLEALPKLILASSSKDTDSPTSYVPSNAFHIQYPTSNTIEGASTLLEYLDHFMHTFHTYCRASIGLLVLC